MVSKKGYALYSRNNELFILYVSGENPYNKMVYFDNTIVPFQVKKLNDEQKKYLEKNKNNLPEKLSSYIFFDDYYCYSRMLDPFPKGKPYTQMPGGGGCYKVTRQITNIIDLFNNPTVLKVLDSFFNKND